MQTHARGTLGGVSTTLHATPIAAAGAVPDTNTLTAATVDRMRVGIETGAADPVVQQAVIQAARGVGDWTRDQRGVCLGVWEWVRRHVNFVEDESQLTGALNLHGELELLIYPGVLLRMAQPAGDCDDFVMLAGAMLTSAGIPVEVVTVKADGQDPNRWSHVCLQAHTNDGPVMLDCSHGRHLGWVAPRYYEIKGWGVIPAQGQALHARGANMHGLSALPNGYGVQQLRRRRQVQTGGVRDAQGMGDIDWNSIIAEGIKGGVAITNQLRTPQVTYTPTAAQLAAAANPATNYLPTWLGGTPAYGSPSAGISTPLLVVGGVLAGLALMVFMRRG